MLVPLAVRAFAAALGLVPTAAAQQREAVVPPVAAARPDAEFEGDGNSCTAAQMQEADLWWLYEGDALLGRALPALALQIDTEHLDRLLARLASERAADRHSLASWLPTLLSPARGEPLAKFGRGWNYRWVSSRLLFSRW